MWQANVLTIFPEAFPGSLGVSLIGEALKAQRWRLNLIDLKKFPVKSDRIDSEPYGGGVGMVLSPIAFENAFNSLSSQQRAMKKFYLSPRGRQLEQEDMRKLSKSDGITILCGRYEGVDQRIIDYFEFEEISIGDFVLPGGESAATVIIEAIVRLLPDVIGNEESIHNDSFQNFLLEHDQYTRPREFHSMNVPEILLSGDHSQIEKFRLEQSRKITKERFPDLWARYIESEINKIS